MRTGYLNFVRNAWLSAATILILSLVLFVLGQLVFLSALANSAINSVQSKIDISVYFSASAPEDDVLAVKRDLEGLPDVADVSYVSRDQALADFRDRHKGNALIVSALEEVGDNPLQASVNIRAKDPSRYKAISQFLQDKKYPIVDKINYFENQVVIDRLSSIITTVRSFGVVVALLLAFIAVLVAYNTIRLVIYTVREEIGIMKLVGAASWFVRGPFLVTGMMYGAIAAAITTAIFFPMTWFVGPKLMLLVPEFDLYKYFLGSVWQFFVIMFVVGVTLSVSSSFVAVRRYLLV